MDIDCPNAEPTQDRPNHLYNVMGSVIALLTLVLPLYFTAHYSSGNAVTDTSFSQPATAPIQR